MPIFIFRQFQLAAIRIVLLKGESRQQTNCPTYRSMNRTSADSFTETKVRFGYKKKLDGA